VLFNAAAILIAGAAIVAVLRSLLAPSSLLPCSQRYKTSMVLPLERNGALVTATDIQAGTGGRAAAVVDNLDVVRLAGAPAPVVMSVALPKGSSPPHTDAGQLGGVSFPWQPRSLRRQPAVCLGYSLLLPADFNFSLGGVLPGIFGETDHGGDRFLAQAAWAQGGDVGATNHATLAGQEKRLDAVGNGVQIPRGRWVKLEQEVALNEPAHANGLLRIWVDGVLALDKNDLVYRAKGDVSLAGVAAEFFYSGGDVVSRSPADAKVFLSPLEIHWK
jgi:hypothetical protein